MIRQPAVAGSFYPAGAAALRAAVSDCLAVEARPRTPSPARAVIVPHAGYQYSGRVAGAVYAETSLATSLIILGPNHTGEGVPVAVMDRGAWRTPLGDAPIDEPLARRLLEACGQAELDDRAHRREHSLEVQLPFLQVRMESFAFVPVCVGTSSLADLSRLGRELAEMLRAWETPVSIVVSSDMSHYLPAGEARRRDMLAVERILALDPEGLHRVVREHDISMCGFAPAVAGLIAARGTGAAEARLVAYANSGDAGGDDDRVVGYAGLSVS